MIQYIFFRGERFYLKELQINYYRVLSACALFTTTICFHGNLEDNLQLILYYETSFFYVFRFIKYFFQNLPTKLHVFLTVYWKIVIYYPYNATA